VPFCFAVFCVMTVVCSTLEPYVRVQVRGWVVCVRGGGERFGELKVYKELNLFLGVEKKLFDVVCK